MIKKWNGYSAKLSYLFISWNEGEIGKLKAIIDEENCTQLKEFRCDITDRNIYWIKREDASETGEVVSSVIMAGKMFNELTEFLTGTGIEEKEKKSYKDGEQIKFEEFCEAYIVTESTNSLSEANGGRKIEPICSTDDIKVFYIRNGMGLSSTIQIDTLEAEKGKAFCFWMPIPHSPVRFDPDDLIAGQETEVNLKINSDYQKSILAEPITMYIYRGEETIYEKEMSRTEDGKYACDICLDEAGKYSYSIYMKSGMPIRLNGDLKVWEKSSEAMGTVKLKQIENDGDNVGVIGIVCVGVVILVIGVIWKIILRR